MSDAPTRRILIIEDSPEDRMLIRRMLRETGNEFVLVEAETGEEGLRHAQRQALDCILLDLHLPDMSGFEVLDALRDERDDMLRHPVAILTGLDGSDEAAAALGRGAQDYVIKGTLSAHGLLRVIENSIQKSAILRELKEKSAVLEMRNRQLEAVRRQLENKVIELTEATRSKERFMAVMSHEMRTPLNAVLGYADLLELGISGELSPSQRDYIERIRVGSRHLLDLINDVLDLARAESSNLELDLRPVDAFAVAEEVVALLENQAHTKEIRLVLEPCEQSLPLIQADLQRLRQIMTNLIGNAIKFTDEGEIGVRCAVADDRLEITIEDSGIGIDSDVLPMIFTEFYQADGDLTRRQGGSGLGLAISRRLAQLMGGDIHVQSRLGEGSRFTLQLPCAPEGSLPRTADVELHEAAMEARRAASAESATADTATEDVVVVAYSDNIEGLEELSRRVQPGVRLAWTTRADELPELARRERATLLVLDIACAGGAGWHAAHAVREDPELASVALLLLPCVPTPLPEELTEGLDLGWVTLVPKPFTSEQLTHAVQSAARGTTPSVHQQPAPVVEVLIVDDDPDSRRVASRFLATPSVHIREASDGESALVAMRRHPPDVVVLDLMMPVLDGFGVLAAMRADPLLRSLPVVVLSAKSLSEAERQFLARTAVRVLQKGEHRLSDVASLVLRAAARRVEEEARE
jgi:signal transduction histidine kinase